MNSVSTLSIAIASSNAPVATGSATPANDSSPQFAAILAPFDIAAAGAIRQPVALPGNTLPPVDFDADPCIDLSTDAFVPPATPHRTPRAIALSPQADRPAPHGPIPTTTAPSVPYLVAATVAPLPQVFLTSDVRQSQTDIGPSPEDDAHDRNLTGARDQDRDDETADDCAAAPVAPPTLLVFAAPIASTAIIAAASSTQSHGSIAVAGSPAVRPDVLVDPQRPFAPATETADSIPPNATTIDRTPISAGTRLVTPLRPALAVELSSDLINRSALPRTQSPPPLVQSGPSPIAPANAAPRATNPVAASASPRIDLRPASRIDPIFATVTLQPGLTRAPYPPVTAPNHSTSSYPVSMPNRFAPPAIVAALTIADPLVTAAPPAAWRPQLERAIGQNDAPAKTIDALPKPMSIETFEPASLSPTDDQLPSRLVSSATGPDTIPVIQRRSAAPSPPVAPTVRAIPAERATIASDHPDASFDHVAAQRHAVFTPPISASTPALSMPLTIETAARLKFAALDDRGSAPAAEQSDVDVARRRPATSTLPLVAAVTDAIPEQGLPVAAAPIVPHPAVTVDDFASRRPAVAIAHPTLPQPASFKVSSADLSPASSITPVVEPATSPLLPAFPNSSATIVATAPTEPVGPLHATESIASQINVPIEAIPAAKISKDAVTPHLIDVVAPTLSRVAPPVSEAQTVSVAPALSSAITPPRAAKQTRTDATIGGDIALATVAQPHAALPVATVHDAPLDMGRHGWPQAMIERIEALRDAVDATDTSIRIVPDKLGTIDISVRRDGEVTHVHFAAEQAQTRTILADAQPRLAELADARGLRLGQSSIDAGTGQQQPQHQRPQAAFAPAAPARAPRREDAATTDHRIA